MIMIRWSSVRGPLKNSTMFCLLEPPPKSRCVGPETARLSRADLMNQRSVDIKTGKNVEEGKDPENNVRSDSEGRKEAGGWHGFPPLRCVIAWQEIRASAFQLRNELLRKLELNF